MRRRRTAYNKRMAGSQVRRGESGSLPRRQWLRAVAVLLGLVVLLAHAATLRQVMDLPIAWHVNWPDLPKHITLISIFALAYRLSFRGRAPGADLTSIYFCSGWAGLCEIMQHWIPAREFSVYELAANVLTPIAVVGVLRVLGGWREWFS
jgi:VanZ family protein